MLIGLRQNEPPITGLVTPPATRAFLKPIIPVQDQRRLTPVAVAVQRGLVDFEKGNAHRPASSLASRSSASWQSCPGLASLPCPASQRRRASRNESVGPPGQGQWSVQFPHAPQYSFLWLAIAGL